MSFTGIYVGRPVLLAIQCHFAKLAAMVHNRIALTRTELSPNGALVQKAKTDEEQR
jgi:hypothetical protein